MLLSVHANLAGEPALETAALSRPAVAQRGSPLFVLARHPAHVTSLQQPSSPVPVTTPKLSCVYLNLNQQYCVNSAGGVAAWERQNCR